MHTGRVTKAAIYVRISEDREGRGLGVERQEQDCRALAERLGYTVTELYRDNDISASTKTRKIRPDYQRLLRDSRAGLHSVVIAYTSSRLTRRPRENEDLIELSAGHGIHFQYVASPSFDLNTSAGRRIARILAAGDAGTSEDISELASRKKAQAAADGNWLGGRRPFGYEGDGVTPKDDEAKIVRETTEAILSGESLRRASGRLNAHGVLTSTGHRWTATDLRKVLIRPRNAGLMVHKGVVVGPARWAAIVDPDRWRALVAVVTDPARRTQWSSARVWMLSGIAQCHCGSTVRGTMNKSGRTTVPSYACKESKHMIRTAADLDGLVSRLVVERLSRPDAADLVVRSSGSGAAAMHAESAAIQDRLAELATAFADGAITVVQLRDGSGRLRDKLADVERRLADASRESVLAGLAGASNVSELWEKLDLDRRRAIIDALMCITIHPTKKGRPPGWKPGESYFNPKSIEITWKS